LLKVDVLALGMLSMIRRALDMMVCFPGKPARLQDIPREDPATYAMICRADTIGVFQIESRAQMSMLPRLQPQTFYDLVVQVAIVRPGPIQGGMVHPYLRRRQGLEEIEHYPNPGMQAALERTLGVPIFQEQVMQIAMAAADFTPGEADQLRRAMAAWKRKGGLEGFHDRIVSRMVHNGYDAAFAERIFEQMKGFGDYGFPESHAASFAILAYLSSWIKCHEPAIFLCALLNSQPMGFTAPRNWCRMRAATAYTCCPPMSATANGTAACAHRIRTIPRNPLYGWVYR
jgi:error-prone DNA polymerase